MHLLEEIKQIDPCGVLVLFDVNTDRLRRYEYDGGMAVLVDVNKHVCIEAVGKGFDGREVSKGITVHERYCVPWKNLRKLSIETLKNYREYLVDPIKYSIDREKRIHFLVENNSEKLDVLNKVPIEYSPIKDFTWRMLFLTMIKYLEKMEEELYSAGFNSFAVSGNITHNIFGPWQMFDKNRYLKMKK